MKALTLTQPWATLVILDVKQNETRSWSSAHRGRLAIHAAKGWAREDREFAADLWARGILPVDPSQLPRGAVLGIVELIDVVPVTAFRVLEPLERELGDYEPGRFAWCLRGVERFAEPVVAIGHLGLWDWQQ